MSELKTIDALIDTSGEDDLQGLEIFSEGKVVKRISKEEIEGWSQKHPRMPFQIK